MTRSPDTLHGITARSTALAPAPLLLPQPRSEAVLLIGDADSAEGLRRCVVEAGLRPVIVPDVRRLAGAVALFEPFAVVAEGSPTLSAASLASAVWGVGLPTPFVMAIHESRAEALFQSVRCVLPRSEAASFLAAAARAWRCRRASDSPA